MILKEITEENYRSLPELSGVRFLWHSNYWDGPLTGICEISGIKYWFSVCEEHNWIPQGDVGDYPDEDAWEDDFKFIPRKFVAVRITEEQLQIKENGHKLFSWLVYGNRTASIYDKENKQIRERTPVPEDIQKLWYWVRKYLPYHDVQEFLDNEVIGWFEHP